MIIPDFEFTNDDHVFAYLHLLKAEGLDYHFDDDPFEVDWHARKISYAEKSAMHRNHMRLWAYCDPWAWFDRHEQMWAWWNDDGEEAVEDAFYESVFGLANDYFEPIANTPISNHCCDMFRHLGIETLADLAEDGGEFEVLEYDAFEHALTKLEEDADQLNEANWDRD